MTDTGDHKYSNQHDDHNNTWMENALSWCCVDCANKHYCHDESVDDAENGSNNQLYSRGEPEADHSESRSWHNSEDVGLN